MVIVIVSFTSYEQTLNCLYVPMCLSECPVIIDSVTVELAGYSQRSSKPVLIPKFEINLSDPCWSHHIDEQGLKLTVSTTDANRREKEKYIFKMRSREQLASWAAEIIQATTFEPGSTYLCMYVFVYTYKLWTKALYDLLSIWGLVHNEAIEFPRGIV